MSDVEVKDALRLAKKAYQEAVNLAVDARKNPPYRYVGYNFDPKLYPESMTIGEARVKWIEEKALYDGYQKKIQEGLDSFDAWVTRVTKLRSIHHEDGDVHWLCDWGHQHGSPLRYGDETDSVRYGAFPINKDGLDYAQDNSP